MADSTFIYINIIIIKWGLTFCVRQFVSNFNMTTYPNMLYNFLIIYRFINFFSMCYFFVYVYVYQAYYFINEWHIKQTATHSCDKV